MKAKSIIILSLLLFTATACSHRIYGTVLPQADGSYKAIGSAKKEPEAFKMVESDAKTTCKKEGYLQFYSIDQKSKYVGPKLTDGTEKGMKGLALKLAEAAAKNNTQYNYTVEMLFKCRWQFFYGVRSWKKIKTWHRINRTKRQWSGWSRRVGPDPCGTIVQNGCSLVH